MNEIVWLVQVLQGALPGSIYDCGLEIDAQRTRNVFSRRKSREEHIQAFGLVVFIGLGASVVACRQVERVLRQDLRPER